ncbi:hypothetical protein, conserved [Babesia bigemina]|uniref:Vacuolar protein 14 C-terminal Fig4-binding domain-containing protein n=1 Tax=Babesia bigemina TaxID=5866 RepID=A0A061CZT8_BABBI|nr:hypothetical protein, conserved [Babesia bigemina]CDR93928.1 hypothetical protein, conserved [Babesia bigemina]|eukprot:XP_012766114.1 hypothetical protein, conserved [Babesia bigemina]
MSVTSKNSAAGRHEFLPENTPSYLVDGNPEFRKRARNTISQAVRKFIKDAQEQDGRHEICQEAVGRFLELMRLRFLDNAIPEHRIGGLIGLAAAAIALEEYLDDHADAFIHVALPYFTDQDSAVRYYACESLFNIFKKAPDAVTRNFSEIFDGVCKLCCDIDDDVRQTSELMSRLVKDIILQNGNHTVEMVVNLVASRMHVTNSFVRMLLWKRLTDIVDNSAQRGAEYVITNSRIHEDADVDMLEHLPKLYIGLLNMLVDSNKLVMMHVSCMGLRDVRGGAELCLAEFLSLFKKTFATKTNIVNEALFKAVLINTKRSEYIVKKNNIGWIRELACLQPQLIHFEGFPQLLRAVIMSIADQNADVSACAQEANKQLFMTAKEQRSVSNVKQITKELTEIVELPVTHVVMLTVLQWLTLLLELKPRVMKDALPVVTRAIVLCFKQSDSEPIMEATLKAIILVVELGEQNFELVSQHLLELFKSDDALLEERGNRIIINVCKQIGFEKFYKITAECLALYAEADFLRRIVHTLNWTLLTSEDARTMRKLLLTAEGESLGTLLQKCWEHNLSSALALALWREKYKLANEIVQQIADSNFDVEFWLWTDSLVQLFDTHVFMKMRLHLLKPTQHNDLLQALLGLSMLLPQSETNKQLMRRLSISQFAQIGEQLAMMNMRGT